MGRVRNLLDTLNLKTVEELSRFASNALREIQQIINGNISFDDNFRGKTFTVVFNSANADTKIDHGLGFVPTSYLVTSQTAAMSIYNGTQTATGQIFFLRSSAVGTATVFLF